jgi:hypothetical protein
MAGSDSSTTANSNRNFVSRDGRSATFDRSMTSYLNSRSTNSYDILDSDENKNTKYKYFKKVGMRRAEAITYLLVYAQDLPTYQDMAIF